MDRRELVKRLAVLGLASSVAPAAFSKDLLQLFGELKKEDFGPAFKWGAATAAYQIEGAWDLDGKGPSIWDTFTHKHGKIKDHTTGDVACDFYHRYESDIDLIRQLNMQVFRFSTAWSRLLPQGTGIVNQKGIDFYHRVIDACLVAGIEPWITLYHWDLPQALEDKGGWANRDVLGWFGEYVQLVSKTYGDKVKNWMVFNEPMAFTGLGYMAGVHAPGKKNIEKFKRAVHHVVLCQAEGGRILRENVPGGNIGTTFSVSAIHPRSQVEKDRKAAARMDALFNRLFIEPALGMGYPVDGFSYLKSIEKYIQPGDNEKMKFDFDFVGVQNYFRIVARHSLFPPVMWANQVKPKKLVQKEEDLTDMGWEIYPAGIYEVIKKFAAYKNIPKIIVTENGAAFPDAVENGKVHDAKRVQYFKDYLAQVLKAKKEGMPVEGYFVWSLLDNFEWAEGYHPRFGLVHVDYTTQQRTVKDSGLWFKEFLN
jgi:beta-glucosidase